MDCPARLAGALALLLLLMISAAPMAASSESSGETSMEGPDRSGMVWIQRPPPSHPPTDAGISTVPSMTALPFWLMIRFFQRFISPVDGPTCPMHPTCSRYGLEAIRRRGVAMGLLMTADRLIRDNGDYRHYPTVRIHGVDRYYDPVEANDFWLGGKEAASDHPRSNPEP